MLQKHPSIRALSPEIGCGVGGILADLHRQLPPDVELHGFDIAPEAIARAKSRECERLSFSQEDLF